MEDQYVLAVSFILENGVEMGEQYGEIYMLWMNQMLLR